MSLTRSSPSRPNHLDNLELLDRYLTAKEVVIRAGFAAEVDWQDQRSLDEVGECDFLRETAWVILSSGMRETIIRALFPHISSAFCDWSSAESIVRRARGCLRRAACHFDHPAKLRAILEVARTVNRLGFDLVKQHVVSGGVEFLATFPFIGPVTCYHLAKNLGLDVAKPDRHLVRLADASGFGSAETLCSIISKLTGDRIGVVDIVLWRYATLERGHVQLMAKPEGVMA